MADTTLEEVRTRQAREAFAAQLERDGYASYAKLVREDRCHNTTLQSALRTMAAISAQREREQAEEIARLNKIIHARCGCLGRVHTTGGWHCPDCGARGLPSTGSSLPLTTKDKANEHDHN